MLIVIETSVFQAIRFFDKLRVTLKLTFLVRLFYSGKLAKP